MKKKSKRIPKFRTEAQEVRFWETHSLIEYEGTLKEVKNIKFPKPKKRLVSMRLEEDHIQRLKIIAHRKGIGYLTMIRMWLMERMLDESK